MVSFDYNYQNSSVRSFLVQISAIFVQTSLGLQILKTKEKRNEFW